MPKNTPTRIIDSQKARAVAFLGGSGSAGGGVSDHGLLNGLADDDHAQYLRTDGARTLTGNMAVAASVTIDGVDISAHAANVNAHHNQQSRETPKRQKSKNEQSSWEDLLSDKVQNQ